MSPPAENLPVKMRPARGPQGGSRFLPVNYRPGDFSGGGDPVMGHRLSVCYV